MARTSHLMKAIRKPKFRVQQHNRCALCGRPRAFYRRFRLCRICLRQLALKGHIPGMIKASW